MWTVRLAGAGDDSPDGRAVIPWSPSLARLHDTAPWVCVAAAATTYLLGICAALALTPRGVPACLIDPAPGIAALWLSTATERTRWWRVRTSWAAAAVILVGGPALLAGAGQPLPLVLLHGPVTLTVAGVAVLAWRHLLRPQRAGAVLGMWRLLVTGVVAVLPVLVVVPLVAQADGREVPTVAWLAWAAKVTAGVVGPVLIGPALLARASGVLRGPRAARVVPLLLTTALIGAVDVLADQRLYLVIPLLVWAAATLTVRGTAAYVLLILAIVLRGAPVGAGPFAVGGSADRSLTANTVVLVVVGVALALVRAREERAALLAQVTARTREAVEEARLLATVIAATQDAVVTLDAERRVLLANAAARALGVQCGTSVEGLVAAAGGSGQDLLTAALDEGEASVADLTVGNPDGRVLSLRAFPMRHVGAAGAVVFLQDVTAERRRTEGLHYFARTVAHDLRNPLTGIRLSSELAATALDEGDTDAAAALVAAVAANGDRATRLLRDVADYSLAGDAELRSEAVHLAAFVAGIARQRATEPGAKPLDLRVAADVCVAVDARLVARVFDNVLSNAAKYAVPGSIPSVEVRAWDRGDGRAMVLVQDRGVGIPPGEENRVFEAFHRAPQHAASHPGTGLGLAICRQVVERHGGSITAEPRSGGGTTVRFSLPLAESSAVEAPRRTACAVPALVC